MTEGDLRELRHWAACQHPGDRPARLVVLLLARCAELDRLNLALADKLASEHLGRVAERKDGAK